jgi:hypothetical protein
LGDPEPGNRSPTSGISEINKGPLGGILLSFEIACRIVLTDLDDLTDHAATNGLLAHDRLGQISAELDELYAHVAPASST